MYILAIDTTAKTASVCIAKKSETLIPLSEFNLNVGNTHSETLLPMIDASLKVIGLSVSDIDVYAITSGPGSFTGVRIGVSAIKGLVFSNNKKTPCIPVSTLHCLAKNISSYGDDVILCPLMDARREQFYNAIFLNTDNTIKRICDDRIITASQLTDELVKNYSDKKIIICGDGANLYFSLFEKFIDTQKPSIILSHTKDMYQRAFSVACVADEILSSDEYLPENFESSLLMPTYLRLSQAERERNEKELCKTEGNNT